MPEVFFLLYLRRFQSMEVQIVSFLAMLHQDYLAGSFQNRIHILDPHICDPVNVNLGIQHEALEILVADQLRQQPVVKFARSQYFDCIITQMQSVQLCAWVIFSFCYHFKKDNRKIKYLFNAVRASMWVYFTTIFLLLIWTPHWVKSLSIRLEIRTVINVFAPGNFMYGRVCVAFLLSLTIFIGFLCHYKWIVHTERQENQRLKNEK